jgi:hypothetical protein
MISDLPEKFWGRERFLANFLLVSNIRRARLGSGRGTRLRYLAAWISPFQLPEFVAREGCIVIGFFGKAMVALAVASALSGPALAATTLVSSTPDANADVSERPLQIDLKFSEVIVLGQSRFAVTGPRGRVRTTVGVDQNDKAHVFVSFWDPLRPGRYTVSWHVVSATANAADGSYTFSVKSS